MRLPLCTGIWRDVAPCGPPRGARSTASTSSPGAAAATARAHPSHGFLDARPRERLQQIVDRLHLEGADRVLVVGGREHDVRRRPRERLQHLEAVHARHLHVEEDEVGLPLLDHLQRLDAVGRLADHLDAAELARGSPSSRSRASFSSSTTSVRIGVACLPSRLREPVAHAAPAPAGAAGRRCRRRARS